MNLLKNHPTIFIDNKYLKWYEQLVSGVPAEIEHYEKHHIVPKSILPNNVLVKLTPRQHYIAHLLLTKCVNPLYRNKMLYAVTAMKFKVVNQIRFNSRLFEKLKIEANVARSASLTGITRSEETKAKIRAARVLQVTSDETKAKISAAKKGVARSPAAVEKTRQRHIGSKRSEETKEKLKESRKHYPRLTCKHCSKTVVTANYNRWHGDKCKLNDDL